VADEACASKTAAVAEMVRLNHQVVAQERTLSASLDVAVDGGERTLEQRETLSLRLSLFYCR
jgi:hypothetical protein